MASNSEEKEKNSNGSNEIEDPSGKFYDLFKKYTAQTEQLLNWKQAYKKQVSFILLHRVQFSLHNKIYKLTFEGRVDKFKISMAFTRASGCAL